MFKELTDEDLYLLLNIVTNSLDENKVEETKRASVYKIKLNLWSEVETRYQESKHNAE